jgi:hypothetical protein
MDAPARRTPWLAVLLAVGGLGLILAGGWRGGASAGSGGAVTVMVAARSLDAGAVLAPDDVRSEAVGGTLAALAHVPAEVVGRRLAVAVPEGAPLGGMLLSDAGSVPAAGRRLVRLAVDASALAPDVVPDAVVDVVAAVAAGSDGGRVLDVATARVVAVAGGTSPVVTLDVDSSGAARLFWAQTFAKSLRLLARSAGSGDPPDVSGLG